jgi:hypothetical protein
LPSRRLADSITGTSGAQPEQFSLQFLRWDICVNSSLPGTAKTASNCESQHEYLGLVDCIQRSIEWIEHLVCRTMCGPAAADGIYGSHSLRDEIVDHVCGQDPVGQLPAGDHSHSDVPRATKSIGEPPNLICNVTAERADIGRCMRK